MSYQSSRWFTAVALIAIICASVVLAADPKPSAVERRERERRQLISQCESAVESGRHKQAEEALLKLRKQVGGERDPQVESLLARCALARGSHDEAWDYVAPYVEKRDMYRPALDAAYFAAADALMGKKDFEAAAGLMDWVATHSEGHALIRAAEKCGQAYVKLGENGKALRSFEFAIKYARQNLYDDGTLKPLFDRLSKQLRDARDPLEERKRKEEIEKLGEDFYLFREAEALRRKDGDHKAAFTLYGDIIARFPDSVFAEASRFYQPLCLVQLKAIPEAEKRLRAFHAANPNGPYRGEALLELGRIALEHRLNLELADEHFSRIDPWIEAAKRDKAAHDFYERQAARMKPAAKPLAEAPRHKKKYDQWGNILRVGIEPGQLVNHLTCDWYLDDLAEQAAKFQGFIKFAQGKKEEALAFYERIPSLDEETKRSHEADEWNDYRRLKWGAEHGYLAAYPQELKLYNKAQRGVILIGDFYQCTQQFDKAAQIYRRVLAGEFGKLSPAQADYLHFAIGSCLYRSRFTDNAETAAAAALREFDKALATREGTWTEYRAAKAYYNLGRESRDKTVRNNAQALLTALVSSGKNNEFTMSARIDLALDMMRDGREEQGRTLLESFQAEDGQWYDLAQHHLAKRQTRH